MSCLFDDLPQRGGAPTVRGSPSSPEVQAGVDVRKARRVVRNMVGPVLGFRKEPGSRGTSVLGSSQGQEWGPEERGREPAPRMGQGLSSGLPQPLGLLTML